MQKELLELIPGLRRYAYSLCGSYDDADDLVQSTIERILAKGVPEDIVLAKWAFRVCRNLWIDQYRAAKTRGEAGHNPILQDQATSDGARRTENEIQLQQVQTAMQNLSEDQRSVLALVSVQGLPYKEAAEILEIPVGTVMSRLARARSALCKILETPSAFANAEGKPS